MFYDFYRFYHLIMANVYGRNVVHFNKCILAIVKFYSRIVLKKFSDKQIQIFRKLERTFKNCVINMIIEYKTTEWQVIFTVVTRLTDIIYVNI